jgi:hypothetical protein
MIDLYNYDCFDVLGSEDLVTVYMTQSITVLMSAYILHIVQKNIRNFVKLTVLTGLTGRVKIDFL